jgi:hypothetical protein
MSGTYPRYSKEEFAERGDRIYEQEIHPHEGPSDRGKVVAIDIETGAYEIDADELAASDRLLARVPTAQTWLRRIGFPYVRRFGARPLSERRCRLDESMADKGADDEKRLRILEELVAQAQELNMGY